MPRLVPEESLIRVLNLAKAPVQVTIQDRALFQQPVEAFQVGVQVGLQGLTCVLLKKGGWFFRHFLESPQMIEPVALQRLRSAWE